jgi:outer membrane protein assembly factor BamD
MWSRWVFFPLVMLISVSVGCSSSSKSAKSSGQKLNGTDEQIFIGDTVEKNYDPNVIMKRAESFFDKEDYAEAIIEYQHFLDLHRVHTLASYAQFKLGESHFKQVKTVDRDIDPIYKALDAYQKLKTNYSGSRYEADAGERIQACHRMIAQSYLFVGQFYYRRDAYLAAAHRFEAILKQYPDMDIAGDALYYLALTYKEIGAEDWAREKLMAFTDRYPNHQHASTGHKLLAALNAKQPPTEAVAQATTSSPDSTAKIPPAVHAGSSQEPTRGLSLVPAAALTPSPNQPIQSGGTTTLCRIGVWC